MICICMGYHDPFQTGDSSAFQIGKELILSHIFLTAAAAVHQESASSRHFQHNSIPLPYVQAGDPKTAAVFPGQCQDARRQRRQQKNRCEFSQARLPPPHPYRSGDSQHQTAIIEKALPDFRQAAHPGTEGKLSCQDAALLIQKQQRSSGNGSDHGGFYAEQSKDAGAQSAYQYAAYRGKHKQIQKYSRQRHFSEKDQHNRQSGDLYRKGGQKTFEPFIFRSCYFQKEGRYRPKSRHCPEGQQKTAAVKICRRIQKKQDGRQGQSCQKIIASPYDLCPY